MVDLSGRIYSLCDYYLGTKADTGGEESIIMEKKIMKKHTKRDFSLDFLKALAIFLVCQTHYMHYKDNGLNNFVAIASCMGVPLFFMVNGALLMNKPLDIERHYKKTLRIFVLCIMWKIISVILMSFIWKKNILENGIAVLLNFVMGRNDLQGYELGHFWYLYALVGIYTIFPLFKICYDNEKGKIIIKYILGIIAFFSIGISTLNLFVQIFEYIRGRETELSFNWLNSYYIFGMYGYCIFWFILGGILYPEVKQVKQPKKMKDISFLLFAIGWLLLFLLNRFQNITGTSPFIVVDGYYCVPTVMMCVGIFIISKLLLENRQNNMIMTISRETWGIYMLHIIVGTAFLKVQGRYYFECGILLNFIKSVWMIAASLVVIWIMKKIPVVKKLVVF